ncbi:MAG: ORF6N domain-containing protein [Saprospiraceae bacterium]|nr:ORF6N domain-containing protein [Candidatus Vicinibacter affinis]HQV64986.1 ORF6N domain-containing protein [Candidatus Paceibacterota bacterium]HQW71449.1 ORF6N domain-containing protein [Saprospiraceae bacterium]MBK6571256.1 ORF6N domain-containing protein [Candidatus Vicinibacter affinis]MBK6571267.1 ORF6N domain-containing protein [Candidatus Vicinibacter affinis]
MTKKPSIPDRIVESKILLIRGKKVMIDKDIAELYGVTTKRLNEQVKRNHTRFPEDFMFQLTGIEKSEVVANCDHLNNLKYSPNLPYAFTEYGVVMLASVLNSERAIEVNIQIVRVFTRLREMVLTHKDILLKLEQLEKQVVNNSGDIQIIFTALNELLEQPNPPRKQIGFKPDDV